MIGVDGSEFLFHRAASSKSPLTPSSMSPSGPIRRIPPSSWSGVSGSHQRPTRSPVESSANSILTNHEGHAHCELESYGRKLASLLLTPVGPPFRHRV